MKVTTSAWSKNFRHYLQNCEFDGSFLTFAYHLLSWANA